MSHRPLFFIATFLSLSFTACQQSPAPASPDSSPPPNLEATSSSSATAQPSSSCAPLEELAAMDPRKPVPLQPMMAWHQKQNMMDHLVAIQEITEALSQEDWEGVSKASARIGMSPSMQMQCEHMGAGAEGFTELALDFHRRADEIAVAAKAQDTAQVLQATAHTLQACTTCHAGYKQEVVDSATWQKRTGSQHNPSMMHGNH